MGLASDVAEHRKPHALTFPHGREAQSPIAAQTVTRENLTP
jgi:hypothetical protein